MYILSLTKVCRFFNIFFAVVVLLNAVLLCFHVPTEWGDYKDRNLTIVRPLPALLYTPNSDCCALLITRNRALGLFVLLFEAILTYCLS